MRLFLNILLILFLQTTAMGARIRIKNCTTPNTKDLDFGEGAQNDLSLVVPPGSNDNEKNGCFQVTGDPNATYSVALPSQVTLNRALGADIMVSNFLANTPSGNFQLDSSGSQLVFVGATRAAIPVSQRPGEYDGTVSVSARYLSGGLTSSDSVKALAVVIRMLGIQNISDLDFGQGVQGDPPKTIPPGSGESLQNGSFSVSGEPNRYFQIVLPTSISLSNGAVRPILVDNFTSTPSTSGLLSASGTSTLYVGARRSSLPPNQSRGSYVGTYTVVVVY